ncbi:hypothetical protein EON65_45395 [archaeon]|nr:MAG: hypothetical protein EON65_45395 [archaeon]
MRFCGIDFPNVLESVTYSIEVAEGVDWKEGILSRYINDMTALNYHEVCNLKHETAFELIQLKPATFYHIRLVIHYLGFRVISEAATLHTQKSLPSPPGEARIQIIPIKNSFDPNAELPSRLEMNVTWTPSRANGSHIQRYQVHIKRFDHEGTYRHHMDICLFVYHIQLSLFCFYLIIIPSYSYS